MTYILTPETGMGVSKRDEQYWNFKTEDRMLEEKKKTAFKWQTKNYFSLKDNSYLITKMK